MKKITIMVPDEITEGLKRELVMEVKQKYARHKKRTANESVKDDIGKTSELIDSENELDS